MTPFDPGRLSHVALAVRDLEEAASRLASLGMVVVGEIWDVEVPAIYRGVESRAGLKAAFAAAGPVMIEIVEPTSGASPIATFLQERGEGIHIWATL